MKHTYTSNELPHIWAHQTVEWGKCPGNESFNGAVYKSYNTAIAELCQLNGETVAIINKTSYSSSTARHQSGVIQACAHLTKIPVFGIARGGQKLLPYEKSGYKTWARAEISDAHQRAAHAAAKATRARARKDWLLLEAQAHANTAALIARLFKVKLPAFSLETAAADLVKLQEREAKRERAAQLAREKAAQKDVLAWLVNTPNIYFPAGIARVYLRANNGEMETSKGARVPLKDARRAYRFAKKHNDWRANGEQCPVGNYKLDAISAAGIVAGCHHIAWDEIERFAKTQGWTK